MIWSISSQGYLHLLIRSGKLDNGSYGCTDELAHFYNGNQLVCDATGILAPVSSS